MSFHTRNIISELSTWYKHVFLLRCRSLQLIISCWCREGRYLFNSALSDCLFLFFLLIILQWKVLFSMLTASYSSHVPSRKLPSTISRWSVSQKYPIQKHHADLLTEIQWEHYSVILLAQIISASLQWLLTLVTVKDYSYNTMLWATMKCQAPCVFLNAGRPMEPSFSFYEWSPVTLEMQLASFNGPT